MFIAGGACTRLYYNHAHLGSSDIDIYCNDSHREFLKSQLIDAGFLLTCANDKVLTLHNLETRDTFQLISPHAFRYPMQAELQNPIQDVLDTFDLNVCQMTYMYGKLHFHTKEVETCLKNKKLRVETPMGSQTVLRMIKYMSRYQLTLDLEEPRTASMHKMIRHNLLTTFQAERTSYDD